MLQRQRSLRRAWVAPVVPFLALAAVATFALACSAPPKPAAKAAAGAGPAATASSAATSAPAKPDVASPTSGSIHIEDRILKACGDVPVAHFAFDSANVAGDAAAALDALARCFVSGPLKGKGMRIVGFADVRGETEYNVGLGQRRAGSVSEYLTKKGVEASRLKTLSKGAFEATGTDEAGWARDRKVEVSLLD